MPENALAGGEEDIGRDEPADFGVTLPALEVVESPHPSIVRLPV